MSAAATQRPFYDDSFLPALGHPGAARPDLKQQHLQQQQQQLRPPPPQQQNMNLNFCDSFRSSFRPQLLRADADFYTPDAGALKLACSPELERLIVHGGGGVISGAPAHAHAPAPFPYARGITEEQEGFAEGFVKALDDLHKMNQMAPPNVSLGACAGGCAAAASVFGASAQPEALEYTNLSGGGGGGSSCASAPSYPSGTISYLPHHQFHAHAQPVAHGSHHHFQPPSHAQRFGGLKEEPQTVPDLQSSDSGSPPMSPIDLENQERIKAERKRLRNRLAASKCRRRKLERIARLEDKVKGLKTDNAGLTSTASLLREQVAQLKQKVLTHVSSGCQLMAAPKVKSY